MAMTLAGARIDAVAGNPGRTAFTQPDVDAAEHVRVLSGPTRLYAVPVCAVFSHKWSETPWSRWAFGWDRETQCRRCGQTRHERARLHADLVYEGDR
jgi:hypothetical protein